MNKACYCITYAMLLVPALAMGDEIQKWVDEAGRTHYGNMPPEKSDAKPVETLDIPDSFDPQEYEAAQQRQRETEQALEQYERDRDAEEERKAKEEAERKASIRQPPGFAGPQITLPPPVYESPYAPGRPGIGYPGRPWPQHPPGHKPKPKPRPKPLPATR